MTLLGDPVPPPSQFREWLTKFEGHEVVGTTRDSLDCPLSRWLTEVHDDDWVVSKLRCGPHTLSGEDGPPFKSPVWMRRFIDRIDGANPDYRPVTAKQCLLAFDEVGL